MEPQVTKKMDEVIAGFNSKQKQIASKIVADPSFSFLNLDNILYIRCLKSGQLLNFVDFVKQSCGCD